jgi:hypothetical protein
MWHHHYHYYYYGIRKNIDVSLFRHIEHAYQLADETILQCMTAGGTQSTAVQAMRTRTAMLLNSPRFQPSFIFFLSSLKFQPTSKSPFAYDNLLAVEFIPSNLGQECFFSEAKKKKIQREQNAVNTKL